MINRKRPDNKEKGVLLPVFSLPSGYGIGCFSKEAKQFVDWLQATGHTYWQILPMNPTGLMHSPYEPLSCFAGNPNFIDPEQLVEQWLISQEELDDFDFGSDPLQVDYEKLCDNRMKMLRLAYRRFASIRDDGTAAAGTVYRKFVADNASWLEDYALFMVLRDEYGRELSWEKWPTPVRFRDAEAIAQAKEQRAEDIDFHRWTQFEFYRQWGELKEYANEAGVKIIGDMSAFVSYDSSDCWTNPEMFQMDENLKPIEISGAPPDQYAAEGQLWGNPLYDWEKLKEDDYKGWIDRVRQYFVMFDVIRLDHFRGYESYYASPADAINAMHGVWRKGPGMDLFRQLMKSGVVADEKELKERFIAEDLGIITDEVREMLQESRFPGMKVLHFAFDGDPKNPYLPENYGSNYYVYTGTHDNDTTVGWFRDLDQNARAGILQYLGYSGTDAWWLILESDAAQLRGERLNADAPVCREEVPGDGERKGKPYVRKVLDGKGVPDPAVLATELLVEKALESQAKVAIIPLQDYLHLGTEFRTNIPGTIEGNWCIRMPRDGIWGTAR